MASQVIFYPPYIIRKIQVKLKRVDFSTEFGKLPALKKKKKPKWNRTWVGFSLCTGECDWLWLSMTTSAVKPATGHPAGIYHSLVVASEKLLHIFLLRSKCYSLLLPWQRSFEIWVWHSFIAVWLYWRLTNWNVLVPDVFNQVQKFLGQLHMSQSLQ